MKDVGDHQIHLSNQLLHFLDSKGKPTIAAGPHSIDPIIYLDDLVGQASPDLMRQMLQDFINQILSTQADQICGADCATTSESRTNTHNGYRHRDLDTRVGTVDVAVPK